MAELQHTEPGKQTAPERVERTYEVADEGPAAVARRAVAPSFQGGRIDPRRLTPQAILALQRTVGNRAVNQLLRPRPVQPMTRPPSPSRSYDPAALVPNAPSPSAAIALEGSDEETASLQGSPMVGIAAEPAVQRTPASVPVQPRHPTASPPVSPAPEISDAEIQSAIAWAAKAQLGVEAIREIQTALAVAVNGVYDHDTAVAVFHKQREWRKKGKIAQPGCATEGFFERLGLIFTRQIVPATITDAVLKDVIANHPDGVTVALYSKYAKSTDPDPKKRKSKDISSAEFPLQAGIFAANQKAVGLTGGAITLGIAVPITELGQVIETVQSIHRGLADKYTQSLPANDTSKPPAPPAWTRVKNLALFSHGESYGMGLNAKNAFMHGGLHSTGSALNPPNVKALVRGLSEAIAPDIRVQLFACLTAHDTKRSDYQEWTGHKQGERTGGDSFAATLAAEMGPDASVYGHTTAGHTTENFAARVFGKDAGGGQGGLQMLDLMYPEAFISAQLQALFPGKTQDEWNALHDSLRDQMWAHFKDSISGESTRRHKRYPVPIGQEMFVNPDHARELLQTDWKTWITSRLKYVKPKKAPKKKAPK